MEFTSISAYSIPVNDERKQQNFPNRARRHQHVSATASTSPRILSTDPLLAGAATNNVSNSGTGKNHFKSLVTIGFGIIFCLATLQMCMIREASTFEQIQGLRASTESFTNGSEERGLSPWPDLKSKETGDQQDFASTQVPDLPPSDTSSFQTLQDGVNGVENATVVQAHSDPRPIVSNITTLTILRSIGNPLPPRHDSSQAIRNLNFTLQHESKFPNSHRHWILNRLVDSKMESTLQNMLEQHGENYTIIPFDLKVYQSIRNVYTNYQPYGLDQVHRSDYIFLASDRRQNLVENAIRHDRMLYVGNVNGARNTMIDIGLNEYGTDWVLPWDGNCFLTPTAFEQIYRQLHRLQFDKLSLDHVIDQNGNTKRKKSINDKYAISPMVRLLNSNEEVLSPNFDPVAEEEPQIIFHKSSKARFNPLLRYGHRNKVDLLMRLNVPGAWQSPYYTWYTWEETQLKPNEAVVDFDHRTSEVSSAGWVIRLFSGKAGLEGSKDGANRNKARLQGFYLLLMNLDARVATELHGYHPNRLLFYNEDALKRDREAYLSGKNVAVNSTIVELIHLADSITDMGVGNSSFFSSMARNVTVLTLAYYMTGQDEYAKYASETVKVWFLNNATRVNRDSMKNVVGMKPLFYLLDGIRVLQARKFLDVDDQEQLRNWFENYLEWLENSEQARTSYTQKKNGLHYDMQIVSVAAFVNKPETAAWSIDRSVSRLQVNIKLDGALGYIGSGSDCELSQLGVLTSWTNLARLGQSFNSSIWNQSFKRFNGGDVSDLCQSMQQVVPFFSERQHCSENGTIVDGRRWLPIWYNARRHCPHLQSLEFVRNIWLSPDSQVTPRDRFDLLDVADDNDAVAPFWTLGISWDSNDLASNVEASAM